jgi:Xaa-Pro dipeptidase
MERGPMTGAPSDRPSAFTLPFSPDEYQRRLEGTRRGMAARGVDLLLVTTPENVTYLTGYETIGYSSFLCLVVPADHDPALIVRDMELEIARSTTWLHDFATVADTEDPIARTRTVVSERARHAGGAGLEQSTPFLTPNTWLRLRGEALAARPVTDCSGLVEELRRVKSPAEIGYIRRASELAGSGMAAATAAATEGATENQVASAAFAAMVNGGSDFMAADPIVTSGPRARVAHTTFANRRLVDGDEVLVELGACQRRYFGALMRTLVVNRPDQTCRRLEAVVREALEKAIAAIRPGATCGEVDAACRDTIEAAGFGHGFRKRTGYSIGVAYAPDWGEGHIASLQPGDGTVLEPGMVFHLPPAIRLPDRCVGLSETVLVTDTGHEVLTSFPRELLRGQPERLAWLEGAPGRSPREGS